jgi:predicted adenylyl cyclase CyaB
MTHNIEVEIRSFVNDAHYASLEAYFRREAEFMGEDNQETHYFDAPVDLRIQRNDHFAKIWMKKGAMHAEAREEHEVRFDRNQFEAAASIFAALGYKVKIKWFRKRLSFRWGDVTVALDDTLGYGKILELEKMATEETRGAVLADLKAKMAQLGVGITPKAEFDARFADYAQNWEKRLSAASKAA